MKITIELNNDDAAMLATLDANGDVSEVLSNLASSIADGVRRPGSWERQVVYPLFGDEFESRLVADDDAPWREKPAGAAAHG